MVMDSVPSCLTEQALNGGLYALRTSDLRWYMDRYAQIVCDYIVWYHASIDNLLAYVNNSNLIDALFKSSISDAIVSRKKEATESYFGGLGFTYVISSTNKVSQEACNVQIERAHKRLYVINPQKRCYIYSGGNLCRLKNPVISVQKGKTSMTS